MMKKIYLIIDFVVIAVIVVAYGKWDIILSRAVLQQWADRERLEILKSSHRSLFRGPYSWNSTKKQSVHYIKARNANGKVRLGWVRLGSNAFEGADVTWID